MSEGTRERPECENAASLEGILVEIGSQMIDALGVPDHFQRVEVRLLWDNRYRANILVGSRRLSVEIRHIFFVIINGEGIIQDSLPKMERLY